MTTAGQITGHAPGQQTWQGVAGRLRRRAAVLAGAALVAAPLAACGAFGDDSGPPTLTWYINPDAGGQAEIASRCTEEADGAYTIDTSLLPRDATSQREQLVRRLASNDSSIDLMSIDPPFIPEFAEAGFLAPVPAELAESSTEDIVESAQEGAMWDDELVTVPFWANTQLLWYRKSAVEDAGLDLEEPVTWAQILEAARESGSTVAVQGTLAESLTVWANALVASAGGEILPDPDVDPEELDVQLDTEAGRLAATIMREVTEDPEIAGSAVTTADEDASNVLFMGDSGGFMVNYPFVYAAVRATLDAAKEAGDQEAADAAQEQLDDIGWAIYPRAVEGEEAAPPYGGINLGVGAFSEHVDLSYDAIACIVTEENQAYYFVSNGNPPAKNAAYDDKEVRELYPMAPVIRESLDLAAPRPQTPYYSEVSGGLQRVWHPTTALDPEVDPAEAEDLVTAVLRKEALL